MPALRLLILATTSLVATACTAGDVAEPVSTVSVTQEAPTTTVEATTSSTMATTSTTEDPEVAVLEALAGYNQAYIDAATPFEPEHPDLERYATDPLLGRIQSSYAEYASLGYVGGGVFSYRVISIEFSDDRTARVLQCGLDATSVQAQTGEFVASPDTEAVEYFTELVWIEGVWKVSREGKSGEIERPCELDAP